MKNPQILFGIVLLVSSMSLIGVLVATKRKPNVYNHANWDPVFEFIQNAEKVDTIATTYDGFEYKKPPLDPFKVLNQYDPNGHHQVKEVPQASRAKLVAILKKMPEDQESVDACFCPHHFIVASKGSQKMVLSMCFNCNAMGTDGAMSVSTGMRKDTQNEVSDFFGLDVFPDLKDRRCIFNRGTYDPGLVEYGVKGPQ